MVLLVVLFFALLITSAVATFVRRSTLDGLIVRNREYASRTEAAARGGIQLARALLIEDLLNEGAGTDAQLDTEADNWALVGKQDIVSPDGTVLRLDIRDVGSRLNLNGIPLGQAGSPPPEVQAFVELVLEEVIEELPIAPGERALYDPEELAENLIDWMDSDGERLRGGPEDAWYQDQDPPYRAANRPLLSVDELGRIEGFDGQLVEGLRPYVTVHPYFAGDEGSGINPNTAPPYVLKFLFYFNGVDYQLADEQDLRAILEVRQDGRFVCERASSDECTPISEVVGGGLGDASQIFPPPSYSSSVFLVTSRARFGDVERTIEATLDRRDPTTLRVLSWRVR